MISPTPSHNRDSRTAMSALADDCHCNEIHIEPNGLVNPIRAL